MITLQPPNNEILSKQWGTLQSNCMSNKKGLQCIPLNPLLYRGFVGARTPDPLIKSQLLYQLSYESILFF